MVIEQGKIYLVPNYLGNEMPEILPVYFQEILKKIDVFVVENEKPVRRLLVSLSLKHKINDSEFIVNNVKEQIQNPFDIIDYCINGRNVALVSDAGTPSVADPGSEIVIAAHLKNIEVVPLIGPNSMMLALMASGLNGQSFAFWGYLPVKSNERVQKIKNLEKISKQYNQTQIFIETPYRNLQLYESLISSLKPDTKLCIAASLTCNDQYIKTNTVKNWLQKKPDIQKKPAIFLILAS